MFNGTKPFAYSLVLQVFIPKGKYNGQKLIKEVSKNTAPNTSNTIPVVPDTVLVRYNTAKTMATRTLIMRSALPIFFFIIN